MSGSEKSRLVAADIHNRDASSPHARSRNLPWLRRRYSAGCLTECNGRVFFTHVAASLLNCVITGAYVRTVFTDHRSGEINVSCCISLPVSREWCAGVWSHSGFLRQRRPIELRFYVPLDTKTVISETFFLANLLA